MNNKHQHIFYEPIPQNFEQKSFKSELSFIMSLFDSTEIQT